MTSALAPIAEPALPEVLDPLPTEQGLAELEAVVDEASETVLAAACALAEIHRRRLYKRTHRSFEKYLRDRFDLSLPRGYELVRAARVADAITSAGGTPPASEAAMRPLSTILVRQGLGAVAEAWERVLAQQNGGGPPTSRQVRELLAATTPVTPHRSRLDEAGRLLTSLERYVGQLAPLDESLRATARRYAARARLVADDLDALGGVVTVAPALEADAEPERGPLPEDESAGVRCACARPMPDGTGGCVKCGRELPWQPRSPRMADLAATA